MGYLSSITRTTRASSGASFLAALVPVTVILIACGSSSSGPDDDITPITSDAGASDTDSSTTPPLSADAGTKKKDAGTTPTPGYPAAHSPIPPVTYNGGNILDALSVVTVTFTGDAHEELVQGFDDTITATAWWDAVTAGYCDTRNKCIGHGTSGGHVVLPSAGGSYTDTETTGASTLKTFIDQNITSKAFPLPTANTLYVIYFPSTTTINLDGSESCNTFGGYHDAMTATANGVQFAYAILPRCSTDGNLLTFAASHEIIESATDPYIASNSQTYYAYGSLTDAWDYIPSGGEVGDRCVSIFNDGSDQYQEGDYIVQRTWSNTSAKGSHAPCVPAPAQPYFNVAPANGDVIDCAVGATVQVPLVAFSDAPMPAFSMQVQEVTQILGGQNVLSLSLDKSSASNGDAVTVSVTMNQSPSQGAAAFILQSTYEGTTNYWPFLVQTP